MRMPVCFSRLTLGWAPSDQKIKGRHRKPQREGIKKYVSQRTNLFENKSLCPRFETFANWMVSADAAKEYTCASARETDREGGRKRVCSMCFIICILVS